MLPKMETMPVQVTVLQDKHVASSAEQFLLYAKSCAKVTTFGQPSAGVLDYANMRGVAFPCYPLELYYATTRSRRIDVGQGVDGRGVLPLMDSDVTKEQIMEARTYMER
jgi:hypothetical protein